MTNPTKPQRKPGFRLENMDDELLLFNPSTTRVLYLNPSASVIWQLCDGTRTIAEITSILSEAYPEAANDLPEDVQSTIKLFLENGAVDLV